MEVNAMPNGISGFADASLEDAVMGACLIDSEGISVALSLGMGSAHFTQRMASMVFEAMADMNGKGEQVDLLTVTRHLRNVEGGISAEVMTYMTHCTGKVLTSAHLETHCRMLHELYVRRETMEYGKRLMSASGDMQEELLEKVRDFTDALMEKRFGGNMYHVGVLVRESERSLTERIRCSERGEMQGITTGLGSLDRLTNGWQNSALNIIAGRPGMGKTAMALHFAISAARSGKSVCIYSLEMSRVKLADRMLLALSNGLDGERFRNGSVTADDIDAYQRAMLRLRELPIFIDDRPVCTTGYIRTVSRRMKDEGKCDMVVVDYLQLTDMTTGASRQFNREQQVSKTSREFKILAKELDVPVLLLSQLSRAVEGRLTKRPQLSDLRESGSIEQDADVVAFVYRPEYYGEEGYVRYDERGGFLYGVAQVIIAKQRDGGLGTVDFSYDRTMTRIWDSDCPMPAMRYEAHVETKPPDKQVGFEDMTDLPY